MGFHTYDPERAPALEDESRYERVSVEELLGLFDPDPDDGVVDVGSGTGFYTDDVAAHVGTVCGVDVQPEMHVRYREKGVPENVALLAASADALPFRSGRVDAAFSTMTYHEFATPDALAELFRVLVPGGRVGVADWTRAGPGDDGPPLDHRYDVSTAADAFRAAGFDVERATERHRTFALAARKPE